jgi:hypothetical protein
MRITPGATDQSVHVHMSAADGTDKTDLVAATMTVKYNRGNGALVTVTLLSDLAAIDSAHSDGGVKHVQGGDYRIDLPDAAWVAGVTAVRVYVTGTDAVQTAGAKEVELRVDPLATDDARIPEDGIASAAQMGIPAGETPVIEVVNGRVVASNGFEAADRVKLEAVHTVKPDNKPTVNAGGASLVSNPTAGVSIDFEDGKVEIS